MGVKVGLMPQQGVQKWVLPSLGSGLTPEKKPKTSFRPLKQGGNLHPFFLSKGITLVFEF